MISNRLSLTTSITTTRIVIHVIIPPFGTIKQVVRTSIRMQFIMESQYINIKQNIQRSLDLFSGQGFAIIIQLGSCLPSTYYSTLTFIEYRIEIGGFLGLCMDFCFHIHKSVIFQPPISEIHFCVKGFFHSDYTFAAEK